MSLKNKIEKIITAIKDSNISEIEVTNFWGAQKIKLRTNEFTKPDIVKKSNERDIAVEGKNTNDLTIVSDNLDEVDNLVSDIIIDNAPKEKIELKEYTIIKAPLVGTFYQSSKPGDKPFVEIGSKMNIGDPLCIIEAMKIFNTIESEYEGEIKEIFIQDGEPIEYGQALFSIDIN